MSETIIIECDYIRPSTGKQCTVVINGFGTATKKSDRTYSIEKDGWFIDNHGDYFCPKHK